MPAGTDVLSPQQRAWAGRYLAVLGLPSAHDDATKRQPLQHVDSVGESYQNYVAEPHGALKKALESKTAAMITPAQWLELAQPQGEVRANAFKPFELGKQVSEWFQKNHEVAELEKANTLEASAITEQARKVSALAQEVVLYKKAVVELLLCSEAGTECDLRAFPQFRGVIKADDLPQVVKQSQAQLQTIWEEFERQRKASKEAIAENKRKSEELSQRKPPPTVIQDCLRLLDEPANNPERDKVTALLAKIESIDKEIGPEGKVTKETAGKKIDALAALEKQLNEWHDRRTRQGVAPSAEAVALSDLVQKAHLGLVTQALDNPDWDPPVDGFGKLPAEERKQVQQQWNDLRDCKGMIKVPKGSDATFTTDGSPARVLGGGTDEEAAQFRRESLANFARLMGSEAGRGLVKKLAGSKNEIRILRSDKAECVQINSEAASNRGEGCASIVGMTSGKKAADSSQALYTENGNFLYSPSPIIFGHELIHALHNSKGKSQYSEKSENDAVWTSNEEYRTITGANLSEQALRQQYGLTARRHGHKVIIPDKSGTVAYVQAMDDRQKLSDEKTSGEITKQLEAAGLGKFPLCDRKRIEFAEHKVEGLKDLIEWGWDLNLLTPGQARTILNRKYKSDDLKRLMSGARRAPRRGGRTQHQRRDYQEAPPPSVPERSAFPVARAGGRPAPIADYNSKVGGSLSTGKPEDWESELEALEAAQQFLESKGLKKGHVQTMVEEALHEIEKEKSKILEERLMKEYGGLLAEGGAIPTHISLVNEAISTLEEKYGGDSYTKLNQQLVNASEILRKFAKGKKPSGFIVALDELVQSASATGDDAVGEIEQNVEALKKSLQNLKISMAKLSEDTQRVDQSDVLLVNYLKEIFRQFSHYLVD